MFTKDILNLTLDKQSITEKFESDGPLQ